jgi:multisubunit Na+/H+ antiporter MnhG subunit
MNEIINYLCACLILLVGLPLLVYLCSKMATLGYLRAKDHYNKSQSKNQSQSQEGEES